MILTDEIRCFSVSSALPPEKIKTYREYWALAVLKYSFEEKYSKLHKAESPDLQDDDGELGVEVTSGISPCDEIISGENYKYTHAKSEVDKMVCIEKIKKAGGDRSGIGISYPVSTSEKDRLNIINVFKKKVIKADSYKKKFRKIGLSIIIDIPIFFFDDKEWANWLMDINCGKYDFVAIIHDFGVDVYDFKESTYYSGRIPREDMDALKRLARMATEEIIKDDNTVWY